MLVSLRFSEPKKTREFERSPGGHRVTLRVGTVSGNDENSGTLGRIALKKMSVRKQQQTGGAAGNPMNRLVPYLDLFGRLNNEELSRLSRVPTSTVEQLRGQVVEVQRALHRYGDLLARLSDDELARLTGASPKTIRFWRLSSPKPPAAAQPEPAPQRPDADAITQPLTPVSRDPSPLPHRAPSDSGISGKPFANFEPADDDVEIALNDDEEDLEITRDDFF